MNPSINPQLILLSKLVQIATKQNPSLFIFIVPHCSLLFNLIVIFILLFFEPMKDLPLSILSSSKLDHPASIIQYYTTPPHRTSLTEKQRNHDRRIIANNANRKSNPTKSHSPHRRTASPPEPPGRTPIPHPPTQKTTPGQRISPYITLAKTPISSWHGIGRIPEKTGPSRPPIQN